MHLYSVALFKKLNHCDPDPFSLYLPRKAGTGQGTQGQTQIDPDPYMRPLSLTGIDTCIDMTIDKAGDMGTHVSRLNRYNCKRRAFFSFSSPVAPVPLLSLI